MYRTANRKRIQGIRTLVNTNSGIQNIRFDETDSGLALYLDNEIQFIENEERTYHHALAGVPVIRSPYDARVLILGGGDGLAARTIYELKPRSLVSMCELDPVMISVCSSFEPMVKLNKHSIRQTNNILGDAVEFVQYSPPDTWDVIICDFPDMKVLTMDLYSPQLYGNVARLLRPGGLISVYPGGQYHMVNDALLPFFKKVHTSQINIETMGSTPILCAEKR